MNKKISSILLLSVLLTVSCGQSATVGNTDTTASGIEETTAEPVKTGLFYTTTPEEAEKLELEGYNFNIYLRLPGTWCNSDLYAAEENGDNYNDAVYRRNMALEDKFGFTITATYSAETYLKELGPLVLAGDDTFDAAFPMASQAAKYAQQGVICDLNTLAYLDFDSEVWAKTFSDTISFGGKLFMATGDISTNAFDAIRIFMFNKDIHRNFKLENPYELVKSGKWTLDAFGEMVASASADLNGDSQMTTDDQWGIAWQTATGGNIFFYGADEHLSDKNKDDIPYLSIGSDRSHTVFDKIQKMIADKSNYYQGADQEIKDIFTSGRSLFLTEVLYHVKSFRDSTVDFGVLPVPKFDENQKDYIQYVDSWCPSPAVVPVTAKNLDRAGFFLQIMAETGREYIRSEYYDKCLNGKFLRDEESSEMLDIIVSHYVVENAVIYGWGGLSDAFKSAMNGTDGLASLIASYKTKCESEIQKTIDIYQSLD